MIGLIYRPFVILESSNSSIDVSESSFITLHCMHLIYFVHIIWFNRVLYGKTLSFEGKCVHLLKIIFTHV